MTCCFPAVAKGFLIYLSLCGFCKVFMSPHSEDSDVLQYEALFQMLALVRNLPCCSPLIYRHPQEHLGKTKKQTTTNQKNKTKTRQPQTSKAQPKQNQKNLISKPEQRNWTAFVASCGLHSAGIPLQISAELLSGKDFW